MKFLNLVLSLKYKEISSELFSPKYLRPRENKYLDKVVILELLIEFIRLKKIFHQIHRVL